MAGILRSLVPVAVDVPRPRVYHHMASGRPGDRGISKWDVEESPYSTGHGAGEIPGRSDLSERATEKDSRGWGSSDPHGGDDEKAV